MGNATIVPHLQAADRWLELGTTSATNPVLQVFFEKLFLPLGLACEYMVCDPITNTGCLLRPTFVRPSWDPEKIVAGLAEFIPPPEILACYATEVRSSGKVVFTRRGGVPQALLAKMEQFNDGRPFNLFVDECRLATSRLIWRAFERACLPTAAAEQSELFVAAPAEFADALWRETGDTG